jgi:WD40 repeat protein
LSNYKVELERTERQDLEIKKHISDVKAIIKSKVNKDVNGLNSIKELLENETLGGYIVDDFIKIDNLEVVDWAPNPADYNLAWKFTGHTGGVRSVAVDSDGNVYSGSGDKKVMKISPDGQKLWEFTGHTETVWSVAVDSEGNVYSGAADNKVIKISPTGQKLWEFTGHTDFVWSVAVDSNGNVYSGDDDMKVMKNELKREPLGYKVLKVERGL